MEVLHKRCCGLDVHKKTVVACVITPKIRETRTFTTMTNDLLKLEEWLLECKVTHVAMESTGVFWKPVYNVLENSFVLLLVNPQHIKALPGRKTDVQDAEWIADLLRHGLVKGSFVPDREQRELRELSRCRRSLLQERNRVINRIQKVLEGSNIKLSSVATDIVGVSGRAILEAMVNGVEEPKALAEMAKGLLRKKMTSLEEALKGMMGEHQKMIMATHLRHLDFLDGEVARMDIEVNCRMVRFKELLDKMDEIPGIDRRNAEEIIAEIGTDMSRFLTAAHLASWAGLCPGNNQSGGKRHTGKTRKGNRWLCSTLVQAARGAARSRGNYLSAQYHRLVGRRGDKRAIVAVAHSILLIIYSMLRNDTKYQDLGGLYFDKRDKEYVLRRAKKRIEALGYKVTLQIV
jgi:transposase